MPESNTDSGPVSRGDTGVVEKQLTLLEGLGGDHAALYGLMTRRAVGLAERRATPPAAIDAIAGVVEESLQRSLNQAAAGASGKARASRENMRKWRRISVDENSTEHSSNG